MYVLCFNLVLSLESSHKELLRVWIMSEGQGVYIQKVEEKEGGKKGEPAMPSGRQLSQ